MSTEIEQRIVQMQFDNADFEKRIAKSMKSLEEFDKSLDLKNTGKAFEQIEAAANKVTLSGLQNSIEKVKDKFTTLEMVGFSVINRLVNKFADAGERMVKSLSIDQITQGWDKYAEKTSSVQTIMAATADQFDDTAEQMEYVNEQLEKLNWFTDETSYNFLDMVNNIGKFTSNNIPLERSITAMQGIANWAAISGANANEASRAMYNLSQAISLGYVQRLDWKSIENANMATSQFKETAVQTAVELGKLKKVGDGMYQTLTGKQYKLNQLFTDGLQTRWLDNDALLTTIDRYGQFTNMLYEAYNVLGNGDIFTTSEILEMVDQYKAGSLDIIKIQKQTGVSSEDLTKIFDKLIDKGNELGLRSFRAAQEAKTFAEAINATKDAVSTGWMKTFEIIFGDYEEAKKLWTGLANNLYDIFAGGLVERNNMLAGWKELGGRDLLFGTEEKVGLVTKAFENLSSIVSVVRDAFRDLFPKVTSQGLYDFTKRIYDLVDAFEISEEAANTLRVAVKALLLPFKAVLTVIKLATLGVAAFAVITFKLADAFLALFSNGNQLKDILKKTFGEERYVKMAESMSIIITKLSAGFSDLTKGIHNAFSSTGALTRFSEMLKNLSKILEPFKNMLFDGLVAGLDAVASFNFSKIGSAIGNGISNFTSFINDALRNLADGSITLDFSFITNGINAVTNAAKKLFSAIEKTDVFKTVKTIVENVVAAFKNVTESLDNMVGRITPAKIMLIGLGVAFIALELSVSKLIDSLATLPVAISGAVTKLGNSASGVLNSVKQAIDNFTVVKKYREIAQAIIILTVALGVLAAIDPSRLKSALIALGSIAGILLTFSVVTAVLNKFAPIGIATTKAVGQISKAFASMAVAILALAAAFKLLDGVNMEGIGVKILSLVGVITVLSGAVVIINKLAPRLNTDIKTIAAFAVALTVTIYALNKLSTVDLSGISRNVEGLLTVTGILVLISLMAKKIDFSSAAAITLMSANLVILAGALTLLSRFKIGGLVKNVDTIIVLLGAMFTMAITARAAGKYAAQAGLGFAAIGASMLIIASAIKVISKLDAGDVLLAAAIISALGIGIAIMSRVFGGSKDAKNLDKQTSEVGKTFLSIAASMIIIAGAIKVLAGIESSDIAKGVITIGAISAMFLIVNNLGKTVTGTKGQITSMAAVIGILVASLTALTIVFDDFGRLMGSTIVLSTILIAFGATMRLMSTMDLKSAIGQAVLLGVIISAFTASLLLMEHFEVGNVTEKITAMGVFLLSFAGMFTLMKSGKGGNLSDALPMIGIMIGVLTSVGMILIALDGLGLDVGIEQALALSTLMLALAAAIAIMGKVSVDAGTAVQAALALVAVAAGLAISIGAFLGIITGIIYLFGKFESALPTIEAGGRVLNVVAQIIGDFVGTLVGSAISSVGPYIVAFGNSMKEFADAVTGIGGDAIIGTASVIAIMTLLNAGGIFNALGTIFGSSTITSFGENLEALTPHLVAFAMAFQNAGITEESAKAAFNTAEALGAIMTAIPKEGGLLQSLLGQTSNLKSFAEDLTSFTPAFGEFCNEISAINVSDEAIKTTKQMISILNSLIDGLPRTGGVFQDLVGGKDLQQFASDITVFGNHFKPFCDIINTIDVNDASIEATKAVCQILTTLVKGIPSAGGAWQEWSGNKSLQQFASDITVFGNHFKPFCDIINTIDIDDKTIKTTKNICEILTTLANDLPRSGGAWQKFFGGKDLGNLGDQLKQLAEGISEYAKQAKTSGESLSLAVVNGLSAQENNIKYEAKAIGSAIIVIWEGYRKDALGAGTELANGFKLGIDNKRQELINSSRNAGKEVLSSFKDVLGIRSPSKEMENVGVQVIAGLVKGLGGDENNVAKAMEVLGKKTIDAIKKTLGIHSPSTVARDEVGVWIVRGIAEGIKKDATAEEIAAEKAKVIIEAFQSEFDKADWAKTAISGNYDIWAALAEDQASEDTKALKEYQKNKELMNEVLNEVSLAAGEVAAQKALGASAEEIEKANEKYLSAIKEFTSLAKELNEYENREYDRAEQEGKIVKKWTEAEELAAKRTYYETVREKMDMWVEDEKMGIRTVQQAKEDLAKELCMDADLRQIIPEGPKRTTILETANKFGSELFGAIMGENFYIDYLDNIEANVDNIGIEFAKETKKAGSDAADTFGEGFKEELDKGSFFGDLGSTFKKLLGNEENTNAFKGSAANLIEGLIDGLNGKLSSVGEAGSGIFDKFLSFFNKEAEIHSPSKVMEEAGGYLIQGIINGLDSNNSGLEEAGKNVVITINNAVYAQMDSIYDTGKSAGERLIDGVIASINNRKTSIANTVGSVLSAAVSIPVRSEGGVGTIGLTPVRVSGTGSSSGTVNPTATLSPITTSRMASEVLSLGLGPRKFETQQTASGKSITFIQNNTSPKALSTAEIYRQTNNIIAAGKEAIKE